MKATLYGAPASHPSACVEKALQLKAIDYERKDLTPLLHKPQQQLRFGSATVPGLVIDGQRVVGSRRILRKIEELVPQPPLYPTPPGKLRQIEEAEAWGDEVLQQAARRIAFRALRGRPDALRSFLEGAELGLPHSAVMLVRVPALILGGQLYGASGPAVDSDLLALPDALDRIDRWIENGLLGGNAANAADLQIGSSLRLLLTIDDLRPVLEGRPGTLLAERHFPDFAGRVPAGALSRDSVALAASL